MRNKLSLICAILFFGFIGMVLCGCEKKNQELVVYSGQGLKNVMEEIIQEFENKHKLGVKIIYAGSGTLLKVISKSKVGDLFIPGSDKFITKAGNLVLHHQYVAQHIPTVVIHKGNPKDIRSFEDILKPGIKIAVGNKNMSAIGRISAEIIHSTPQKDAIVKNITTTASTVNELLELVLHKEVDAAFIWRDMKLWNNANDLDFIQIPPDVNKTEKIHIAVLSTTTDKKNAMVFAEFVTTDGRKLFAKHGFGDN